jgi:hypothetical protein
LLPTLPYFIRLPLQIITRFFLPSRPHRGSDCPTRDTHFRHHLVRGEEYNNCQHTDTLHFLYGADTKELKATLHDPRGRIREQ